MFNRDKPLATINHTVNIELPDLEAATAPVIDRLAQMGKTVFITLAIGIPCAVLFGFAAHVASEVAINNLTTSE